MIKYQYKNIVGFWMTGEASIEIYFLHFDTDAAQWVQILKEMIPIGEGRTDFSIMSEIHEAVQNHAKQNQI